MSEGKSVSRPKRESTFVVEPAIDLPKTVEEPLTVSVLDRIKAMKGPESPPADRTPKGPRTGSRAVAHDPSGARLNFSFNIYMKEHERSVFKEVAHKFKISYGDWGRRVLRAEVRRYLDAGALDLPPNISWPGEENTPTESGLKGLPGWRRKKKT
jgi:hypothetical protein